MTDRKAGAPGNESDITEEMIEAGVAAIGPTDLIDAWDGYLARSELVAKIYRAMKGFAAVSKSSR